jgi:ubiquinone/menaquinone biosynthesis C-methylase UbiE
LTTAIIRLTAAHGDAPGYIREGLEFLRDLGELTSNSDLYRKRALPSDRYEAVAALTTQLDAGTLRSRLREGENRRGTDSSHVRPLQFDVIHIAPATQAADAFASALPASASDDVVRIEGTANRTAAPTLDYDAPGGPGAGYDELRPLSKFSQELFSAAAAAIALHPGMKILDVGCGTGRFSTLFAQWGALVTGLDRSATMLTSARASTPAGLAERLRYVQADANQGLPPESFDAVAFFMSIQYVLLTDSFFQTLHEALASNGMVTIVTFPHRHFIENEFLTRYFPSIPRIDLARFPSIPELERLLQEHHFGDISARDVIDESDSSGDELITKVEGKYVSTLHLLEAEEFERGLAALRADVAGRKHVRRHLRATVVGARARPVPSARRNI